MLKFGRHRARMQEWKYFPGDARDYRVQVTSLPAQVDDANPGMLLLALQKAIGREVGGYPRSDAAVMIPDSSGNDHPGREFVVDAHELTANVRLVLYERRLYTIMRVGNAESDNVSEWGRFIATFHLVGADETETTDSQLAEGGPGFRILQLTPQAPKGDGPAWAWLALVATVGSHLQRTPVSACDIGDRMMRQLGKLETCCNQAGTARNCGVIQTEDDRARATMMATGQSAGVVNRPATWDQIKASIDADIPLIARLDPEQATIRGGIFAPRALLIVGYQVPNVVYYHSFEDRFRSQVRRIEVPRHPLTYLEGLGWYETLIFQPTQSAALDPPARGRAATAAPTPEAPATPATSSVALAFPRLNSSVATLVEKAVADRQASLRRCYEALPRDATTASPAVVRLKFSIELSAPSWISVVANGGLPPAATRCIVEEVAKWNGAFPHGQHLDESQEMALTFAQLKP
jgi:hypothetical protein